ncbi:hypothetical protein ACLX1H_005820 [Fusarium chlamydosporum]
MVCQARRVRHSLGHGVDIPDTQMIAQYHGTAPGAFISRLPWLAETHHVGYTSPFENYLTDPALGIEADKTVGWGITTEYTRLPLKTFAQRLSLIINTGMRLSYYAPAVLGFNRVNLTELEIWGVGNISYTNTTGNFTTSEDRYEVRRTWMAVYVLSLVLMSISIMATIFLSLMTRAPDFLTNVSALTRDSVHIKVPPGGSTYCGDERARLLKDRRLKIRDVQSEEDIGYVALADENGHQYQQGLKATGKRLFA